MVELDPSDSRMPRIEILIPISFSRARIWRLSAGCTMCTRAAARPKWSSSATATKERRWRNSMMLGRYHRATNKVLDASQLRSHTRRHEVETAAHAVATNRSIGSPGRGYRRGGRHAQPTEHVDVPRGAAGCAARVQDRKGGV